MKNITILEPKITIKTTLSDNNKLEMKDLINKIDAFGEKIIGFIYNKNRFIDKLMIAVTLSGELGIIWIIISFFLFSRTKYTKEAIMVLLAIALQITT